MASIEELKNKFDQAELLRKESAEMTVSLENWDLQDITSQNLAGSSLRVVKDGRKGANTAFGSSPKVEERLIKGAEESVAFGEKMEFDFTEASVDNLSSREQEEYNKAEAEDLLSFIDQFTSKMKEMKSDLTLDLSLKKQLDKLTIETTQGGELKEEKTNFTLSFGAPIPGGGSQIFRYLESPSFFKQLPEKIMEDFVREYEKTAEVSVPSTGKMPVLFSPRALYFLFVSLEEGISARNIYRETSPLLDKKGERIFSEKLNIVDRPGMKGAGRRRSFDDEGIPTREQEIISAGTLKNYIYDLEHAARLDEEAKGNGLKEAMFGGGIDTPVNPGLVNPVIETGNKSKKELIEEVEEGIMVENIIGFHSSNYPQGHFSVQAHGFHLKNGKLQGRLQDVMIAGNIYEDFTRVRSIGDTLYPAFKGYVPYVLLDDVMVTGN